MISALVALILEAALRALLAAVAVWAGLRLLGVGNVLVQKAAWGLVLVAALAMPPMPAPPDGVRAHDNRGYSYAYSNDGEAYAIVGGPGAHVRFNGDWDGGRSADIEKARKMAHGHFLWFRHEGKSYIVDDPAIVAQVEALNKPMDDLGAKMHAVGEQERAIGKAQRDAGR